MIIMLGFVKKVKERKGKVQVYKRSGDRSIHELESRKRGKGKLLNNINDICLLEAESFQSIPKSLHVIPHFHECQDGYLVYSVLSFTKLSLVSHNFSLQLLVMILKHQKHNNQFLKFTRFQNGSMKRFIPF